MHALVVDDSAFQRHVLVGILKQLGHTTVEASDGVEALARLDADGGVDVALIDWNMPRMNGLELLRAVRADPRRSQLRLVMITTEADLEHVAQALDAGADEYIMKPFIAEVIDEKLQLLAFLGDRG